MRKLGFIFVPLLVVTCSRDPAAPADVVTAGGSLANSTPLAGWL